MRRYRSIKFFPVPRRVGLYTVRASTATRMTSAPVPYIAPGRAPAGPVRDPSTAAAGERP
jgi:hypothetical protein